MSEHDASVTSEHVSDLRWDRLLANELSAEQAAETRAHAAACKPCGARLRELTTGRDAFDIPMQVVPMRRSNRNVWIATAASAVAAAALVFLVLRPRAPTGEPAGERTKGSGPELVLVAGRTSVPGGQLAPLASGDVVFAGDSLQAAYTSPYDGFGAVLARDGAGEAFSYVPPVGDRMVALPAGTNRSFPASTTLDDVVGAERVFVLWCEHSHSVAPLLAQLRASGEVATPEGCFVRRVELTKQAPP